MRRDWDGRARENAPYYIDCAHAQTPEAFWASGASDLRMLILQDVALEPSARALEIGCGMGRLLRPLSFAVARAIGVDISPEMIARAREALADRDNVALAVTDGRLPGVGDATLDFVTSFIVFQHVPSRAVVYRYLREAARVLKGGGVLRFQVDGRRRARWRGADTWLGVWFETDALCARLVRMGFDVVDRWGEGTQYLWITARRLSEPGRAESRSVSVRVGAWNPEALERLASGLGLDPKKGAAEILSGASSLRALAEGFFERQRGTAAEDFVRRAYDVLLGRPADPEGLSFYSGEIIGGKPRGYVVDCLLASAEAKARYRRAGEDLSSPGRR